MSPRSRTLLSAVVFSTGVWVSGILLCRQVLKVLLSYHGWMFEPHGKASRSTKIWVVSAPQAWSGGKGVGALCPPASAALLSGAQPEASLDRALRGPLASWEGRP